MHNNMASSKSLWSILWSMCFWCAVADGALAWGTFLGADWMIGEENMRNDLSVFMKNTQRICALDVEKLCLNGRYVTAQTSAYTYWTAQYYKRRNYKDWSDVPLGFGSEADECLRHEFDQYISGALKKRLIPKCVEWIEKTEGQYEELYTREKGDDKREAFVIFSAIFATTVAGFLGYMFGLFLKERDDLFSYQNRDENKKMLIIFSAALSLPALIILWICPRLLMLMIGTFGVGRGVQFHVQNKEDQRYSSLSMGDSGLVFAAVPIS